MIRTRDDDDQVVTRQASQSIPVNVGRSSAPRSPRIVPGAVLAALVVCALQIVSACDSLGTRLEPGFEGPPVACSSEVARNIPGGLVLIRYPSQVDAATRAQFEEAAIKVTDCGNQLNSKEAHAHCSEWVEETVAKSAYYAMELYRALAAQLPPGSVILCPQAIIVDPAGNVMLRSETPSIPCVLDVEFWTMISLRRIARGIGMVPDTFGDRVSPNVTIRYQRLPVTSPDALRATTGDRWGGMFGGAPLAPIYPGGRLGYDFEGFFKGDPTEFPQSETLLSRMRLSRPITGSEVFVSDHFGYKSDSSADTTNTTEDTLPFTRLWALYSCVVLDILKEADTGVESSRQAEAYATTCLNTRMAKDAPRDLIFSMMEAERKFTYEQDMEMIQGVYQGEVGQSIRIVRTAEAKVQEHQRAAEKKSFFRALAGTSLVVAGAAGSGQGGAAGAQSMALATAGANYSHAAQVQERETRTSLATAMSNHFHRILSSQAKVVIESAEGRREIEASSLQELRAKFKALLEGAS